MIAGRRIIVLARAITRRAILGNADKAGRLRPSTLLFVVGRDLGLARPARAASFVSATLPCSSRSKPDAPYSITHAGHACFPLV